MDARCPGAICLGPAFLYNHRLVFRNHCDVEADDSNFVQGVLWELDDEHLYSLDMFEGYPKYYGRTRVKVYVDDDDEVTAWVYYMNTQDYMFPPSQTYFDLVWEGYQQNGVSTDQLVTALNESYQEDVRQN